MKKLLFTLALLALAPLSYAANTATAQANLPIIVGRGPQVVKPIVVSIDTTASDLTFFTPTRATMIACVVGVLGVDSTAATLTFKSGTTTNAILELAASQSINLPLGNGAFFCGQPGEALKIQSSALYTNLLLYVIEDYNFDFSGR